MSVSWLLYCTTVLKDITTGKLDEEYKGSAGIIAYVNLQLLLN